MKPNEGTLDRAIRVIAGILLLALTYSGPIGVWGWIGVVPLLTDRVITQLDGDGAEATS